MGSPHTVKRCAECQTVRPVEDFYPTKVGRLKRDAYCKPCRRIRDRQRSEQRSVEHQKRLAVDPFYLRRQKLKRMYGISHEDYMAMHEAQRGLCAICEKPEKRVLYGAISLLAVDHDHATGKVRSLLCHRCNTALGPVENREFRAKALAYLERHACHE